MIMYLRQGWLILVLAICFGAALAGVEGALKGRIDENKKNFTYAKIPELSPGAVPANTVERKIAGQTIYETRDADDRQVGWVILAEGAGFADKIQLLVAVNVAATEITGISILDQKETPGLGNKIESPQWRAQFVGQPTAHPLCIVPEGTAKDSCEIDALAGATVSSKKTVEIANDALAFFRKALTDEKKATED